MRTIHHEIQDRVDLARTYAEDGAFRTAASILRGAADLLDERYTNFERLLDAAVASKGPISLQGSGPAPIAPREG